MSETVQPDQPESGPSLQTLGGLALAAAVAVAAYSVAVGDLVTAGAVLLYVPVGVLLYRIGEHPEEL